MQRFEFIEGTASKFWEAEQIGSDVHVSWGRIGTAGQSQTKSFANAEKALVALGKLVTEKTGKGYAEVAAVARADVGVGIKVSEVKLAQASKSAPKAVKQSIKQALPNAAVHTAATSDVKALLPPPANAPAAVIPTAVSESLDSQSDRAFEAVRAQIASAELTYKDILSPSLLIRQHGISERAAALVIQRLKSVGLIHDYSTSTGRLSKDGRAIAVKLGSAPAEAPAALKVDEADINGPPWLAQGAPVRWLPEMQRRALASRRFVQPVTPTSPEAAWHLLRRKWGLKIDLTGTPSDAALQPQVQKASERLSTVEQQDAESDVVLLALSLSESSFETEFGDELVNYLAVRHGLPATIDLMLDAQQIGVMRGYYRNAAVIRYSFSGSGSAPLGHSAQWPLSKAHEALRRHLAAAPLAEWQACADKITAALPQIHPSRQPVLALLLPDAPALSNAMVMSLAALKDVPETVHWLLVTATDPAAIAVATRIRPRYSVGFFSHEGAVATVLQERGVDAVAVLQAGAAQDAAGDALACIGTPEAVQALAKVASTSKSTLVRLILAADRWPMAAIAALSRLVAAGGKDASLLMSTLTRQLRANEALLPSLRPWLEPAALGVIDRLLAQMAGPSEVADVLELPAVLAAPPWLAKTQKQAAGVLLLAPLTLAPVEQWAPGIREAALAVNQHWRAELDKALQNPAMMLGRLGFETSIRYLVPICVAAAAALEAGDADALIANWRAMMAQRKAAHSYFYFNASYAALLPAALGVPFLNAIAGEAEYGSSFMMATHGLAVLPALAMLVRSKPAEHFTIAMNFGSVDLAPAAARAFAKLKTLRETGRAWLLKYPEFAACGLVALALGKAGEARDAAGAALRLLQANGHEALLLDVAGRYGQPEVVQAVRAVLDESPLDRFPTKRSNLPEFWQPRSWRRPVLRNGKALPNDALDHLGQMMTFPAVEEVYGGLAVVRDTCEPASLADFAWDAFSAWLDAGGPSKDGWALTALGLFGDDDTARKLTPFIRAWPGESAHARAVTGLEVLAVIGSDVALMLLNGVAQKIKFKGLQDKAREKIDAIAQARGLTTEELEDRLAPDLGLDERGTMLLDFGPRSFKVGFDETLKPYVREVTDSLVGTRLPDLPKPKKTDDDEKSRDAVERFKLLKKDARTIASQQLLRLELAMCARRRWLPEVFRQFLVEHPLVGHLVKRLVWGVYEVESAARGAGHDNTNGTGSTGRTTNYGGKLLACFRVAEDGSTTTADDDVYALPAAENIRVGVPHALELSAADAAAFGQVFADYELLQPIAQIGRDTYTLTAEERAADKLTRWSGVTVPTGRVLGLANKGWRRGQAQDGGGIWYFSKPLGASKVIELYLDPGIIVGMIEENPEQKLGDVHVGKPSSWGDMQEPEAFSMLDEISASELIRDMEALRA